MKQPASESETLGPSLSPLSGSASGTELSLLHSVAHNERQALFGTASGSAEGPLKSGDETWTAAARRHCSLDWSRGRKTKLLVPVCTCPGSCLPGRCPFHGIVSSKTRSSLPSGSLSQLWLEVRGTLLEPSACQACRLPLSCTPAIALTRPDPRWNCITRRCRSAT